jgi:hypothetical protein
MDAPGPDLAKLAGLGFIEIASVNGHDATRAGLAVGAQAGEAVAGQAPAPGVASLNLSSSGFFRQPARNRSTA